MATKRILVDLIHYGMLFLVFLGYNRLEGAEGGMFALLCTLPAILIVGISWRIAYMASIPK